MRTNALDTCEWQVLQRLLMPANALIVEIMLYTGLRVSDVLNITTAQLAQGEFTVEESKTGKLKLVALPADLLARVKAQSGAIWAFTSPRYLWRHRTRQAVWADVKRAAKAMRIDLNVAPHSARKSYACDLYRQSGSLVDVQTALNHDRLATTIIYLLDCFAGGKTQTADQPEPDTATGDGHEQSSP